MKEIFEQFSIWAMIDIVIMAAIIDRGLMLLRGTRAAQMLSGMLLVVLLFIASSIVPLTAINWMMNKFYSSFIIILIIIFQDDIRHVLSSMGRKPLLQAGDSVSNTLILDEISRAAVALASKRIGALIVIERNILLTRFVDIGTPLDGRVTKEILLAIFHPSSPVHDGAAIIQQGRIAAVGCFLPLTRDVDVDPNMGTRHRAAIGISQETDAVVVIVSEEGASIGIVNHGVVTRKPDGKTLRDELLGLLSPEEPGEDRTPRALKQLRNKLRRFQTFKSGEDSKP